MTAIRERQSDPDADDVPVTWDERPLVGSRRGLTWWAAVLAGFGLALLGAFVNEMLSSNLGLLFQACYFLGAVGAVAAVQRRGLFGPMVQPPLVLAVTVPGAILLTTDFTQADLLSKLLKVGQPLIAGFPTMAITTGATVLLGLFRIYRERDPNAPVKVKSNAKPPRRPADDDAKPARPRGRTGQTPLPASGRTGQTPVPPGRRRNPDEPPRRGRPAPEDAPRRTRGADPGTRGTRKPPPDGPRQPRAPRPPDGEPPRRRVPRTDGAPEAPRRRAPRADDPRAAGQDSPRRAPRAGDPRRNRPWDDNR